MDEMKLQHIAISAKYFSERTEDKEVKREKNAYHGIKKSSEPSKLPL
jgi:hypothetical protein